RSTAIEALRMIWYSLSVSVCAGATVMESPVWIPIASKFSIEHDLVALFVVVTGVFGMAVGDALFLRLSIREGMAKGAGFGAASHGAGTARSYELGQQEGVVASLVMMLSGVVMVLAAPLVARVMF
ncbi:LrgB family protein, partial [Salmonella enterica subsp. enterica serovar Anatum]|nr:LrgB family protein [Salmonella enterica subsp. enterica serovar Anatum]